MKQRKFSFDIPRLKIGPSKNDNRALKDQLTFEPDSPPQTPKSVRPPLPSEIEAELRIACTHVLQGFKPTPQLADGQKPQLDYAAIRGAPRKELEPVHIPLSKLSSNGNEPKSAKSDRSSGQNHNPDAYRYKPHTATEDLFRPEIKHQRQRSRAESRADQLMAGPPPQQTELKSRARAESHSRSQSNPQPNSIKLVEPTKPDHSQRPKAVTRTASTETTGSTPQTDSTDYPWSASTAMTSAAVTPAKGSKRTSTQDARNQEASNLAKSEAMQGDWMRSELAKHKRDKEVENAGKDSALMVSSDRADSKSPASSSQVPTPVAKVPIRKPVPGGDDVPAVDVSRSDSLQSENVTSPDSRQTAFQPEALRPGVPVRMESRKGRDATRSPDDMRSRALSRARSVKRGFQDAVRSASRSRAPRRTENTPRHGRSQSRTRNALNQAKEYIRPGSSAGSRKPSLDFNNSLTRTLSQESIPDGTSDTSPRDSRQNKLKQWASLAHIKGRTSSDQQSRPGSSGSSGAGKSHNRDTSSTKSKTPIDLNRELPPLPSLDSWQDKERELEIQNEVSWNSSQPTGPAARSSRHGKKPSFTAPPIVGEADEIVAARMGSPVLRRAPKSDDIDVKRYSPHRVPPPIPTNPPPQPPTSHPTTPSINAPAPSHQGHTRRRSRTTNQDNFPPSLSEKLRQASASSPDGKPIVATGRAHLVNNSRQTPNLTPSASTSGQSLGSKLGRALSSRRGHVADPHAHHRQAQYSSNHNRTHSDHARPAPRKMSFDDSRRGNPPMLDRVQIPSGSLGWQPTGNPNFIYNNHNFYNTGPKSPALSQHSTISRRGEKEKERKKWWHIGGQGGQGSGGQGSGGQGGGGGKSHWMDQVVKSGAHHGTLVPEGTAGGPSVRY